MFSAFTEESRKIMIKAYEEMKKLRHPYVGSEHLLLAILKGENDVAERLKECGLTYKKFFDEIVNIIGYGKEVSKWKLYTPLLKRIIENAMVDAKENNNGEVTIEHLFNALLEEGEGVAVRIIIGMNIDIDELYQEFSFRFTSNQKKNKGKKLLLDEIGVDLTKKALDGKLDPVIGRDEEIKRVLEILSRRTKNNPILIGEAGVGKTAIVEEIARMIATNNVPLFLRGKRIINLDMASCVSGTKYRGEFEERINKILKEIENDDSIILFIDEIHTIVGAGGAEGAIDASNILKPALARGSIRCIGATTTDEYKKFIEKDGALERRFQKVIIEEPSKESLKNILMKLRPIYEKFHSVSLSDEVIDSILDLSSTYIYDRNQPDAAIDVLDEVCARVRLRENKMVKKYNILKSEYKEIIDIKNNCIKNNDFHQASIYKDRENEIVNKINEIELNLYKNKKTSVLKADVVHVISSRTKIPLYEITDDNKGIRLIENKLKDKVIGQDKAIRQLVNITKRIRLGFTENKCYSFMFIGSSGCGKTLLAKTFGDALFGSGKVIKLDMSEFNDSSSLTKLIGSSPGYVGYDDNNIFETIRLNPFSILILDEVDKASKSVMDLFFQILDEGKIKNSKGIDIRFDNVIIIMTTNIGTEQINVGFNKEKNKINNSLIEYFGTAFMNRIDNVISFNNLNEDSILSIIDLKLKLLKEKYKMKGIKLAFDKNINKEVLKLSNYEKYGARRIDKIIKNNIEEIIIDGIIDGKNNIKIENLNTILV